MLSEPLVNVWCMFSVAFIEGLSERFVNALTEEI